VLKQSARASEGGVEAAERYVAEPWHLRLQLANAHFENGIVSRKTVFSAIIPAGSEFVTRS
jgi:hypothetical protein